MVLCYTLFSAIFAEELVGIIPFSISFNCEFIILTVEYSAGAG